MPARANFMITIARTVPMNAQAAYNIATYAQSFDRCNPIISDFMGDMAYSVKSFDLAEYSYSHAIQCAPNQAVFYFKKGISLRAQGKDGASDIAASVRLEPANPYFTAQISKK